MFIIFNYLDHMFEKEKKKACRISTSELFSNLKFKYYRQKYIKNETREENTGEK